MMAENFPERFETKLENDIRRTLDLARQSVGTPETFESPDGTEAEAAHFGWPESPNYYSVMIVTGRHKRVIGTRLEPLEGTKYEETTYELFIDDGRFQVSRVFRDQGEDIPDPDDWGPEELEAHGAVENLELGMGLKRPEKYDWEDFMILLGQAKTARALIGEKE